MDRSKWEYKKLGEVCEVLDKFRKPVTKSDRVAGQYPYYGATGIQDYVADYIFDGRYLLLGEDGAKWGANDNSAFIIEGKSWVNNHAHILKIDDSFMDIFVMYYLNHKDLSEYITGAVVLKLTQAAMLKIPVPNISIADQQRIVAELDCLNEMIALKQEQLKEFDKLAQSIFYDMFGDPVANEKEWKTCPLRTLLKVLGGYAYKSTSYVENGVKLVQIANVWEDVIKWDDITCVSYNDAESRPNYILSSGDVVMALTRPIIKSLGTVKIARVRDCDLPCVLNQRVCKFVFSDSRVSPLWFYHFARTSYFKDKINTFSSKGMQPNVSTKEIEGILTPIIPLALQQQFAEKIQAIEAQKELVKKSIAETQQLLASRMDYYFD